jgi:DNA repair exonuclease SbcCD ATPase subunit
MRLMAKAESYDDLIFQLGDLARDRLPGKPNCPRTMDRVYRAEEALVARRDELAGLEQEMNEEDLGYQEFQAQQAQDKAELNVTVRKYKKAVDAIEGKVKDMRKSLSSKKAELRYGNDGLKKLEAKIHDMEMTRRDPMEVATARENLKKNRLKLMRLARDIEALQDDLTNALTPLPGQPGAPGILAHKRLLEIQDEAEEREESFKQRMAELDQAIAQKEEEIQAAEDYLDQALFLLGEEVYKQRISDAQLAPFYPRLDRAQ